MLKLIFTTAMLLIFFGCTSQTINVNQRPPQAVISQNILNIPIYIKDNGYSNFSTKIFNNKNELDNFLNSIKRQSGWKRRDNFLYTLKKQNIDFTKNRLLIYRFNESTGSIVIATDIPTEIGKKVTVKIGKKKPSKTSTANVAYYALAYSVDREIVDITFDDGDSNKTITIKTY